IAISTNNDSKQFRFDGVTPMFQAGEVLVPSEAPWLADYEFELLGFPGAAHDDQVDSTSQYLAWVRKKRSLGTKKLNMGGGSNQLKSNVVQAAGPTSSDPMMDIKKDTAAFAAIVMRMHGMS